MHIRVVVRLPRMRRTMAVRRDHPSQPTATGARTGVSPLADLIRELRPLPSLGDRAERTRTFTEADVVEYAELSGDLNPIHLDDEYAAKSRFGRRIVHGFLTAGMISALLGTQLPGIGSIYVAQTFKFLAPVYIGDTITASVEVTAIREEKRLVTLRTDCVNAEGTLVLTGEATIKC